MMDRPFKVIHHYFLLFIYVNNVRYMTSIVSYIGILTYLN
jgi:hypothetical protein